MLGDLDQLCALLLIRMPLSSVGEDADVTLAGLRSARRHVTRELFFRCPHNALIAEVLLHLDNGKADFDVDAPTISNLGLKLDVQVVVVEAETAGEQQLSDIGLDSRFAPDSVARSETAQELAELVR
ncbi:MAG: hypothetical protein DLM61_20365 [Pseudonocardiales bacterium]|nr:MAG: hypothetical protein DLM61_20365 [Pseudonocardiales bacterium]